MKKQMKLRKLELNKQSITNFHLIACKGGAPITTTKFQGAACGKTIAFGCPTRAIDCFETL